jgi:NAD(P)H dehydrogenase (quinone)
MTILITGATGSLGHATIDYLVKESTSSHISILARDIKKTDDLPSKGIDVRIGDYNDLPSMLHAFKGVDVLLLISTNAVTDRLDQHRNAIDAASDCGVKHIVYTSMLKASEKSSFEGAVDHYHTEEYLKGKGIAYTIFRNSIYAEVIPMLMGDALQTGNWYYPAGDARVNFVARQDIAKAIARVLMNPDPHRNKTYEITSGASYTFTEIADLITGITLKPVVYSAISPDAMREGMKQAGMEASLISLIASGAEGIRKGEFDITDDSLGMLLDRKPADLKDVLPGLLGG